MEKMGSFSIIMMVIVSFVVVAGMVSMEAISGGNISKMFFTAYQYVHSLIIPNLAFWMFVFYVNQLDKKREEAKSEG